MPGARTPASHCVSAVIPLRKSAGGSGCFLIAADDGARWWCKALNNPQSPRVPVTEQIVARLGRLIGAPVCEPGLVRLDGVTGWEFHRGHHVEPGWAHGSRAVDGAVETRELMHRDADDNRRRHAGVFALYAWLAGSDAQWLLDTSADYAYLSHDHGFYLGGPDWTITSLHQSLGLEFTLPDDPSGLDRDELERLAWTLEHLSRDEIEAEVLHLPAEWPVTDAERAAVVDFADQRRASVAVRLRALVP